MDADLEGNIMKTAGMRLTEKQIEQCKPLFKNEVVKNAARKLCFYKAKEESLALFRVTAYNRINALLIDHALDCTQSAEVQLWIVQWQTDPGAIGEFVRELLSVIEKETGRAVNIDHI